MSTKIDSTRGSFVAVGGYTAGLAKLDYEESQAWDQYLNDTKFQRGEAYVKAEKDAYTQLELALMGIRDRRDNLKRMQKRRQKRRKDKA